MGRRPEGHGLGSRRGGDCACVPARGRAPWVWQAPGIEIHGGRIGSVYSGSCLGRGPWEGPRGSAQAAKKSLGVWSGGGREDEVERRAQSGEPGDLSWPGRVGAGLEGPEHAAWGGACGSRWSGDSSKEERAPRN